MSENLPIRTKPDGSKFPITPPHPAIASTFVLRKNPESQQIKKSRLALLKQGASLIVKGKKQTPRRKTKTT